MPDMTDIVRVFAAAQRVAAHPLGARGVMIDDERARGAVLIPLGATDPIALPREDWDVGVVTRLGDEIRIVAILAKRPGTGAFSRLLASIRAAGLRPVVVAPLGDVMPALMKRWGWTRTIAGAGFDACKEWRPPQGDPDA
ncbi:MAG: hypothetical protein KGL39_43255 [Patescibacteria group bacterium]|nr:hypothetical protein [Patescibacteria group bacterium]